MIRVNEEIGKQYGCYIILDFLPIKEKSPRKCICKCTECGAIREVGFYHLKTNFYKTCPECHQKEVRKNLIGQKFGRLTVLERVANHIQPSGQRKTQYKCLCDCGNECIVQSAHLLSNHTTSCGCLQKEQTAKSRVLDLTGKTFGLLTVKEKIIVDGHTKWRCRCQCGGEKITTAQRLNSGHVTSCGCISSISEYNMSQILTKHNLTYEQQYKFDDCRDKRKLPFDFAIFQKGQLWFLIELQGQQHYYPFTFNSEDKSKKILNLEDRHRKDIIKRDYCKQNNIPLLEIRYTQFDELENVLNDFFNYLKNNNGNNSL